MSELTDRLRGKYAIGPIVNGEPEFGYRKFPMEPICIEAAARIEELEQALRDIIKRAVPAPISSYSCDVMAIANKALGEE